MAATIQNIELPKKPRALDTSIGWQIIGPDLNTDSNPTSVVNESNDVSGSISWSQNDIALESSVKSDGSYSIKFTSTENGNRTYVDLSAAPYSLTVGKKYRISIDSRHAGSGDDYILQFNKTNGLNIGPNQTAIATIGSGSTTFVTYTQDIVFDADTYKYFGIKEEGSNDNASGYIDNFTIYELENFSNNNHGQIYSGRALEFDGVTDYFQNNGGESLAGVNQFADGVPWTFACWIYFDSSHTNNTHYFVGEDYTTSPMLIFQNQDNVNKLLFRAEDAGSDYYLFPHGHGPSLNKMDQDTWHRLVVTTDGVSLTAYVNGVHGGDITDGQDSTDASGTFSNTGMEFSGWGSPYQASSVRSQPFKGMMSDGQVWDAAWSADDAAYDYANPESLALNASGTALTESNLKLWYPMQDGHRGQQSYILDGANTGLGEELANFADGNITFNNSGASVASSNSLNSYNAVGDGSTGDSRPRVSFALTTGQTYKIEYTPTLVLDGGVLDFFVGGSRLISNNDINTSFTKTFTSGDAHEGFDFDGSQAFNVDFTLSLKAINDKHHATTVFYGDELVENESFATSGDWTAQTGWTVSGNGVATVDSSAAGTTNVTSTDMAVVVGRTYYAEMVVDSASGTGLRFDLGGVSGGSYLITTGLRTATITALTTAGFSMTASGSDTAAQISRVSVKEVGVASGWTDADQQLHIPQPALQSYNELAWFDGAGDHIQLSDPYNYTSISISAWVYPMTSSLPSVIFANRDTAEDGLILYWAADTLALYSKLNNTSISSGTNLTEGEWQHVVFTHDGSSQKFYINGVEVGSASNTEALSVTTNARLMKDSYANQYYSNGSITEVAIFGNRAIGTANVLELYNEGKARDAMTITDASYITGYFRNNGLKNWTDLSTNSNDGIVETRVTNASYNGTTVTPHNANSLIAVGMAVDGSGIPDATTVASITDSTEFELSAAITGGAKTGQSLYLTRLSGETLLIPQGVDETRDSQGFIMNKPRDTSSLNFPVDKSFAYTTRDDLNTKSYVEIVDYDGLDFGDENFSIECWVKPSYRWKGSSSLNTIISLGGEVNASNSGGIVCTPSTLNGYVGGVSTGTSFTAGEWHHIVLAREGLGSGEIKLYKNGTQANTSTSVNDTGKSTTITNALNVTVGGGTNMTRGYEDLIDGVKIYNKALSATEVLKNYKATKGSHRN